MENKKIVTKLAKGTMTELKMPAVSGYSSTYPRKSVSKLPRPISTTPTVTVEKGTSFLGGIFRFIISTLPYFAYAISLYLILLSLCYNGVLEPCSMRVTYYRQCQKDIYFHQSYTTYKEDYLCLMPGVFYHAEERGWNLDIQC